MGRTAWPLALYLIILLKPGSEGAVELHSSPTVVDAECGTEVNLNCKVPPQINDLSVKHMGWSQNGSSLCSVDTKGNLSTHHKHSPRPFHCSYSHGHLSLRFHNVKLLDGWNSTYMCKLRSNKGTAHTNTTVQFKDPNKCFRQLLVKRGKNGVGSLKATRTLWCISVLFAILKQY